MEVLIVDQALAGKTLAHVLAVQIHLARELIQTGGGQIFNGFFYAKCLQGFAQVIKLFGLLQSNFFTGKTAIRQERNIPFLDQTSERFAHRSSTYAEPLAELLVMKLLAGQDFVAQDQIFDLTINSGGKIFRSSGSDFGFSQRVRHEEKIA